MIGSPQALAYGGIERVGGQDRYETMRLIVGGAFESSDWATVASGDRSSDALCASALAGAGKCPVILTSSDSLSPQASSELDRLQVKSVSLMGGTSTISPEVESAIKAKGISCTRLAGADHSATSVERATWPCAHGLSWKNPAVTTGLTFSDALSVAAMLGKKASPLLLASDAVTEALRGHASEIGSVIILGAEG